MAYRPRYTVESVRKILDEKVKGKWVPCHDEFGHHYRHVETGEVVDSVTTKNILAKEHLVSWAAEVAILFLEEENRFERLKGPERDVILNAAKFKHTDIRDDAGDVGTAAHKMIELYVNDWIHTGIRASSIMRYVPEGIDPRAIAAARCAENFLVKENVTPIASELTVGIPGLSAGNLDLLVLTKDGKIELIDWKTSNAIDMFYALQTAAYRKFLMHMCQDGRKQPLYISKIRIVKLDKFSDRPKVFWVPRMNEAFRMFGMVSELYDYKNSGIDNIPADKVIIKI